MPPTNRRDLLKKAGMGALALGAAPVLGHQLAASADASGQINFHFVAISFGPTIEGVVHVIAMSGDGAVMPRNAIGGGSFVHFDGANPVPPLATGTWKVRRLNSFEAFGTWGVFSTGLMDVDIDLIPEGGPRIPANLEMTCNLAPPGLFVDPPHDEGYILTVPSDSGELVFEPAVPAVGVTVFTIANEQRRGGGS